MWTCLESSNIFLIFTPFLSKERGGSSALENGVLGLGAEGVGSSLSLESSSKILSGSGVVSFGIGLSILLGG